MLSAADKTNLEEGPNEKVNEKFEVFLNKTIGDKSADEISIVKCNERIDLVLTVTEPRHKVMVFRLDGGRIFTTCLNEPVSCVAWNEEGLKLPGLICKALS
jgi:hypothetical protein